MRILDDLQQKIKVDAIRSSSGLLIILILICVASAVMATILYLYLVESSKQVEHISIGYVKLNSISTITYLKEILQNKIQVVSSNLDILSSLDSIKNQNLSAIPNLEAAQSTTSDLTEGYGWINEKGMGIWSTAFSGNDTTFQNYSNLNASERQYFKIPKETFRPFVSESFMITEYNQVPRFVIAYPVLSLKSNTSSPSIANSTDIKQSIYQELLKNVNLNNGNITNETLVANEKNFSRFEIQPILYDLDTNYLKNNYEFKGIVTTSINSAALDRYINNALSTRNIINDTDDSNSSPLGNYRLFDPRPNSDEFMNVQYSNMIHPPSFSAFLPPLSPSAPSDHEILSQTLRPSIIVTDNTGKILFSSDERISPGSNYISAENLDLISNGYDSATADFLVSVLHNLTSHREKSYSGTLELVNKEGEKMIVNFEPIMFNGKHIFYLSTNTKFFLSETANNLITHQITFTFIFIGCLLVMIFSFIAVILSINKKLKNEVSNKTSQLLQNIQDLKLSNEKLHQSEEMEREFVNTAAHELRTPTQAITGYSEINDELFKDIIKNNHNKIDEELERITRRLYKNQQSISRNALRLNTLINNILDVARLESSSSSQNILVTLHKEKLDIIKEINDIINFQLENKVKEKNIQINFSNKSLGEYTLVYVDRSRLNQILNNLLDNAIKFSKQDGSIDIVVKKVSVTFPYENKDDGSQVGIEPEGQLAYPDERKEVYVAISDSGKGLSTDIMSKLFGKFITGSDYGTGLGLYITKKLVAAHGGRIWAYNNNDGIGATFIFSLPTFTNIDDNSMSL